MTEDEELIEKLKWNLRLTRQERTYAVSSDNEVIQEEYWQYTRREIRRIIEASRRK